MTDILEQLERDSPTRPGKDLPAVQYHLLLAVFFSVLSAVFIVFHVDEARLHHVHSWQVYAIDLSAAILAPWIAAFVGYGQLKRSALAAGTSAEVLRSFLIHGSRALLVACTAMYVVFMVTLKLH